MIYVDSGSTSPYFNFALEYYLITEKDLGDSVFLFWRTAPTLMVGKFQNTLEEINEKYVASHGINVVRRMSGGGTIYTDMGGWQFTFISKGSGEISFSDYISPVVGALRSLGVTGADFNGRNDLVIDGKKFSGNAQYMHNGYTLHHGSLLFATDIEQMVKSVTVDEYKVVSKGIKSVKDRVTNISDHLERSITPEEFKETMVESIMGGTGYKKYKLTDADIRRIEEIAAERFDNWDCKYGKNPKFNISRTGRFDGGKMEFKLDVDKGIIKQCAVHGDFFGSIDIDILCQALTGIKYEAESISLALDTLDIEKGLYKITKEDILNAII